MPISAALVIRCDKCQAFVLSYAENTRAAVKDARRAGWEVRGLVVHCPKCVQEAQDATR